MMLFSFFLSVFRLGACCDVFAEEEAGGLYSMNGEGESKVKIFTRKQDHTYTYSFVEVCVMGVHRGE